MRTRVWGIPKSFPPLFNFASGRFGGNQPCCTMPKSREYGDFVKGLLLALHNQGISNREIAHLLRMSKGLQDLTLLRLGPPSKTSQHEDFSLKRFALSDRKASLMQLLYALEAATGTKASRQTVSRRLTDVSIFRRVAKKAPRLSKRHKADRLKWAKRLTRWTFEDWCSVFWTDKSKFQLFGNRKHRLYVAGRKGEPTVNTACSIQFSSVVKES